MLFAPLHSGLAPDSRVCPLVGSDRATGPAPRRRFGVRDTVFSSEAPLAMGGRVIQVPLRMFFMENH